MKEVRTLTGDQKHKDINKKLTQKQWLVYYYIMSICKWNSKDREDHYFIYKNINVTEAAKIIGISRPTFYTALNKLQQQGIIVEYDDYYIIEIPKIYAAIDQQTLSFLLPYQKFLGADLIRTYVLLCRIYQHPEIDPHFNKTLLVEVLGHHRHDSSMTENMELILGFLSYEGLIELKRKEITTHIGHYTDFCLIKINTIKESKGFVIDSDTFTLNEELCNKLKEIVAKEGLWAIEK